jgi:NADH-quinone oxidoreductase subunit H
MFFVYLSYWLLEQVLSFVVIVVPLLIAVAFFTLAERKIMAAMQRRSGPHIVGYWGLLQPFADGVKLLTKQTIVPNKAQRTLFIFAPVYTFALALSAWVVIPYDFDAVIADISLGVVYLLTISTLSVYGIIIAGWASNSKYAFLGALRAAAQMISYDVSLGLILLSVAVCAGSCNLTEIVLAQEYRWFILPFLPLAFMFFVSSLAETNRAPFDLTEAEAELVAGYNVEYSAVGFVLFFLAEYANMLLMSIYFVILFLGGWYAPLACLSFIPNKIWLAVKTVLIVFLFIWVRASLPRFRYDQLMSLGWKVFLPWSLFFFIMTSFLFLGTHYFA